MEVSTIATKSNVNPRRTVSTALQGHHRHDLLPTRHNIHVCEVNVCMRRETIEVDLAERSKRSKTLTCTHLYPSLSSIWVTIGSRVPKLMPKPNFGSQPEALPRQTDPIERFIWQIERLDPMTRPRPDPAPTPPRPSQP